MAAAISHVFLSAFATVDSAGTWMELIGRLCFNLVLLYITNLFIQARATDAIFQLKGALFDLELMAAPPSPTGYYEKIHYHCRHVSKFAKALIYLPGLINTLAACSVPNMGATGWTFRKILFFDALAMLVLERAVWGGLKLLLKAVAWVFPEANNRMRTYNLMYLIRMETEKAVDERNDATEEKRVDRMGGVGRAEMPLSAHRQWVMPQSEVGRGAYRRKQAGSRRPRDYRK